MTWFGVLVVVALVRVVGGLVDPTGARIQTGGSVVYASPVSVASIGGSSATARAPVGAEPCALRNDGRFADDDYKDITHELVYEAIICALRKITCTSGPDRVKIDGFSNSTSTRSTSAPPREFYAYATTRHIWRK